MPLFGARELLGKWQVVHQSAAVSVQFLERFGVNLFYIFAPVPVIKPDRNGRE